MKKTTIFFFIIIFITLALRLIGLGSVPYGFANDEVSYIISGYTIAQTGGVDIAGKFFPLSINLDSSLSPVPVYIIALSTKLFGLSPFVSRLPFALLGIGSVILIYYICKELFKKDSIALISSLIFTLSSWHIFVTRGVWDVIPAQFFYLLGLYIFLKKVRKGSILWSLPAFFLGFFSYHGTKVFFVFFLLLLALVFWNQIKKRKKELIFFFLGILFIFALFAFISKTQSVMRQQEIIFLNKGALLDAKKTVDFERAKSSAPYFLRVIESNKATYFIQKMTANYLGAFSMQHLFTIGDINPIVGYGVFFRGVLYLVDLPFLIFGFIYLIFKSFFSKKTSPVDQIAKYRLSAFIIVGSLLISPLPSTVAAGTTYIIRSFMMAPFLSVIIGVGVYAFWNLLNKYPKYKVIGRIILIILYMVFVTKFLYQYYYQFNSYGSEYWNGSSRQLSEYILINYSKYDKIIVAGGEDKVILQYAMASHANSRELQIAWQKDWPKNLGKVTFINSCYKDSEFRQKITFRTLYVVPEECHKNINSQQIIVDSLEPLRVIWKLYEN